MNISRIDKILILCSLYILVNLTGGFAISGTPETLFLEANSFYENNDYHESEKVYKKILDYGIENELVYYNLGNACFKQNRIGEAILYYERALELSPHDQEIKENLAYANTLKYDKVEMNEESPPMKLIKRLHHFFNLNTQLLLIVLLFYFFSFSGISLFLKRRKGKEADFSLLIMSLLAVLLFIFVLSAGIKIYHKEYSYFGIVLVEKVDVLSGPGETNAILFPMHEGLKVKIRDEREGWYQISLPNGLNGWIKKDTIGVV